MSTPCTQCLDNNGYAIPGFMPSGDIQGVLLAQNVAQQFTVPDNYTVWYIRFAYQAASNVVVRINGTATMADGTIGAELSEYKPEGMYVNAGDTVSFLTPDAAGAYVYAHMYWVR